MRPRWPSADRSDGTTIPFDWVGIPAFQFIQDGLDYTSRTHHSNLDTVDHLQRDDMVQASVVLATFLWHAANRDEVLPRKPCPPSRRRSSLWRPGAVSREP